MFQKVKDFFEAQALLC